MPLQMINFILAATITISEYRLIARSQLTPVDLKGNNIARVAALDDAT